MFNRFILSLLFTVTAVIIIRWGFRRLAGFEVVCMARYTLNASCSNTTSTCYDSLSSDSWQCSKILFLTLFWSESRFDFFVCTFLFWQEPINGYPCTHSLGTRHNLCLAGKALIVLKVIYLFRITMFIWSVDPFPKKFKF